MMITYIEINQMDFFSILNFITKTFYFSFKYSKNQNCLLKQIDLTCPKSLIQFINILALKF